MNNKKQELIVVTNPELGWDCVVCVVDSEEAAACYLEFDSVEEMDRDGQYILHYQTLETQTR
jgi:hypothetical protein